MYVRFRATLAALCALAFVAFSAPAFAQSTAARTATAHPANEDITRPVRVSGTIVDVAVSNPAFSTLVTALTAADLVTTLQGKGPFTVFAPTNDAFAKLPPEVLGFLLSNTDELKKVLLYHVAAGRQDLRYAVIPLPLATVQGQRVFPLRDRRGISINNSRVVLRPIVADNGTIYVIDSVLLPQYR